MKSDNYKLMLLAGAMSASFAAKAVVTAGASNVLKVSNDGESSMNSVFKDAGKATDANVYGHVKDRKSGEHMPYATIQIKGTTTVTPDGEDYRLTLKK